MLRNFELKYSKIRILLFLSIFLSAEKSLGKFKKTKKIMTEFFGESKILMDAGH